ncbi:MAG: SDR family NAD(P)-dependent oxidoreductase [Opitutales bacterium]
MTPAPTLFDLSGKTAFITGAGRGIGATLARGLASAGARVVVNDRHADRIAETVSAIEADGNQAVDACFDCTDEAAVLEAMPAVEEAQGGIDILINNAGIHRRAPLEDMDLATWRTVIDHNLTTAFVISRSVVRGMIARKAGKIINICSLQSEIGRPTTANYAAAKGGLKMLTRAMTVEWAQHNIQINGIAPGYLHTALTDKLVRDPDFNAMICRRTPAGRWGKTGELVGAAVFLAGEASTFVNGQIITVDGGLLCSL